MPHSRIYTNNVHIEIKVIFEYHVKVKFKQQLLQALKTTELQRFQIASVVACHKSYITLHLRGK